MSMDVLTTYMFESLFYPYDVIVYLFLGDDVVVSTWLSILNFLIYFDLRFDERIYLDKTKITFINMYETNSILNVSYIFDK